MRQHSTETEKEHPVTEHTPETPDPTIEYIAHSLGSIAASLTDIVGLLEHLRTFGMPSQR